MCKQEKIAYGTLRGATLAAVEQLESFGRVQRPYECECGDFHLTSKGMHGAELTADMVWLLAETLGV